MVETPSAMPYPGNIVSARIARHRRHTSAKTGNPAMPLPLPSHSHASVCSFRRICDDNKIRLIKVHHFRHTVGSLLKDLGVPARDAQTILGHTRISTTLEIYTDTDEQARRDALTRLQSLLGEAQN